MLICWVKILFLQSLIRHAYLIRKCLQKSRIKRTVLFVVAKILVINSCFFRLQDDLNFTTKLIKLNEHKYQFQISLFIKNSFHMSYNKKSLNPASSQVPNDIILWTCHLEMSLVKQKKHLISYGFRSFFIHSTSANVQKDYCVS